MHTQTKIVANVAKYLSDETIVTVARRVAAAIDGGYRGSLSLDVWVSAATGIHIEARALWPETERVTRALVALGIVERCGRGTYRAPEFFMRQIKGARITGEIVAACIEVELRRSYRVEVAAYESRRLASLALLGFSGQGTDDAFDRAFKAQGASDYLCGTPRLRFEARAA